jgi:hypothetical protein
MVKLCNFLTYVRDAALPSRHCNAVVRTKTLYILHSFTSVQAQFWSQLDVVNKLMPVHFPSCHLRHLMMGLHTPLCQIYAFARFAWVRAPSLPSLLTTEIYSNIFSTDDEWWVPDLAPIYAHQAVVQDSFAGYK